MLPTAPDPATTTARANATAEAPRCEYFRGIAGGMGTPHTQAEQAYYARAMLLIRTPRGGSRVGS